MALTRSALESFPLDSRSMKKEKKIEDLTDWLSFPLGERHDARALGLRRSGSAGRQEHPCKMPIDRGGRDARRPAANEAIIRRALPGPVTRGRWARPVHYLLPGAER